jgi:hypothetical protein
VLVQTPGIALITVNGVAVQGSAPLELSLAPGLYRLGVQSGEGREQFITVKPGVRLRVTLKP